MCVFVDVDLIVVVVEVAKVGGELLDGAQQFLFEHGLDAHQLALNRALHTTSNKTVTSRQSHIQYSTQANEMAAQSTEARPWKG